MTPERWKRIEDVFHRAIDLGGTERRALLDAECAGDSELRGELELMLASAARAADSLHETIARGAELLERASVAGKLGSRLGPYRLRGFLGEGGMGTVYLASRDDAEYQRDVAIKILQPIGASPVLAARLRDERQLLASLDHPGIVRLLDGGSTDDGLPYLVMEYIDGIPLGTYARGVPVRQRVELVAQVAAAVQYAHQKLVVHRDVKPSNILVDAAGAPHLLDFGIAKLLDDSGDAREVRTRTGMPLFTAEYASPEQARGEPVTVATDVYSLGAVLYELLAGRPPQQRGANLAETLGNVCEREPALASAVAPPEIRRELAGDLDNIVLKALQKAPERRYASAAALIDDLKRYLAGLPVAARAATPGYRARKYLRRHRGKLAITVLIAGALTTAAIASIVQARRADRHAAAAERDKRSLLRERGIEELAAGHASRALTYFAEVLREGGDTPAMRFLIAEATRPLAHELVTIPVAAGTQRAAWSQDGTRIAIAAQDGRIAIHTLDGAAVTQTGPRDDYLQLLSFTADDQLVVAAYASGQLAGWDTRTGERRFAVEITVAPWTTVWAATPRGDTVVVASHAGNVRVIDAGSGRELAAAQIAPAAHPSSVAVSPDRRHVAIGIEDGDLYTWEPGAGDPRRIDGNAGGVRALRYSPDGTRLYSGGADHAVRVRDAATGQELAVLGGAGGAVTAIAVDRRALRIAALSQDETAAIWNARTAALVATVGAAGRAGSIAWSPDGEYLAVANRTGTFSLWDPRGNLALAFDGVPGASGRGAAGSARDAQFSPDSKRLFTMSSRDVRIRRADAGPLVTRFALDGNPYAVTWSPDDRRLAIVGQHVAGIWDADTARRTAAIDFRGLKAWDAAWSPDGARLAVTGDDGHVSLHDAAGTTLRLLAGHRGTVNSVRWRPDGAQLATAGADGTVRIWDAASGAELRVLRHGERATFAGWRADGMMLATAGSDHKLRLWDPRSGALRQTIDAGAMQLLSAVFDPAGRSLVATSHGGDVAIFDVATGKRSLSLGGHTDAVPMAAWSPDGELIATAGYDGTLRIWDPASGSLLATRPTGSLMSIAWNRDGTRLVDVGEEGLVRIWDAHRAAEPAAALIDAIARRVPYRLVGSQLERAN